ncbi:hypothetical protein ACQP2Y_34135 [Actinoplanes sp. CA-051413]|uniref:hypothetical protein n=1 Tax=Actinoplanes sp. CA-051413 TaxID=3239899 RepID=UPI003D956F5B
MRRGRWALTGLLLGAAAGALWGWFGSGGYEAGDAAIGTGLLGAVTGALAGAISGTVADRRHR